MLHLRPPNVFHIAGVSTIQQEEVSSCCRCAVCELHLQKVRNWRQLNGGATGTEDRKKPDNNMSEIELKSGMLLKHGEYRIERVLGQGGFGITYEAEQVSLGRRVAVKEFYMKEHCNREGGSQVSVPSTGSRELVEKFRDKFVKEARMLAGFDHQSIVRVIDVFEENGTAYYVMKHLDGGSLQSLVNDRGRLSESEALRYIREIAGALDYIHRRGTLHLDVKPGNIMLDGEGRAVLIDFGISKHVDVEGHLTSSTPLGISKGYAPFEQVAQEASSTYSAATDIYSLGATLYFLLTGNRPPEASALSKGLSTDELKAAGVSVNTINAVRSAMMLFKDDRPQSVEEFLELLDGKTEGGNAGSCGGETGAEDGTLTYGTSRVNSRPDGANVFVDGVQIGSTKGSLETRLEPGNHIVRIEKGGYDAVERNVAITAGRTSEIRAELARRKPAIGAAAVTACIVAALLVAGLFLWRPWQPQAAVTADSDTVLVAQADSSTAAVTADVPEAQPQPSQPVPVVENRTGSIKINSEPKGAQIWLDGKNTGLSTNDIVEDLKTGKHSIKLVLEGYETYTGTIDVKEGRTSRSFKLKENPKPAQQSFTTASSGASTGKTINGHEYVDLGLSVKWATCNVGASSPERYGDYFAWGETRPKNDYSWSTFKYCNDNTGDSFSKYNQKKGGTRDNRTRLELSDDAARANWGGSWRMPTLDEIKELMEQCSWQWTTVNGHSGYRVTSKRNGRSIFLPAAGYSSGSSSYDVGLFGRYWSSSLYTGTSSGAYFLNFHGSYVDWGYFSRRYGLSVRAVSE